MEHRRSLPDDPPAFYEAHVFCCTNDRGATAKRPSCAQKGSDTLRDYMKAQARAAGLKSVRINSSGCLDRCELGCTMLIYPESVWYTYATKEDVDEIIEMHLKLGERVERLMLTAEQRSLRAEQLAGRRQTDSIGQ